VTGPFEAVAGFAPKSNFSTWPFESVVALIVCTLARTVAALLRGSI
jgi:hypothetical protein